MAKEWANGEKYHPSSGALKSRVQMPRAKASVRIVPTWGERKSAGGAAGGVKPVRPVLEPVRLVWDLQNDKFGFRARTGARVVSGGHGSGGWAGEFTGGQVARRSPPRVHYGDGRSRSFEKERGRSTGSLSWFWSSSRQRGAVPSGWLPWWCSWR
jgi:hypothetical protein